MAITNGGFESAGDWTYSEVDTNGSFSGARTTDWAQSGSYSYNIICNGENTVGDYGQILQSVYVDGDTLFGYCRWHTSSGGTMTAKVIINSTTVWSKSMDIGNPDPPPIEFFSIDVSAYFETTVDLILRMEADYTRGSDWNTWWDSISLVTVNYYVKASGGSDANDGTSWADADAWTTVNKGMTTIDADKTLHIGFGSYASEPANNDISPVAANVTVIYETAVDGGGTGTATIEVN